MYLSADMAVLAVIVAAAVVNAIWLCGFSRLVHSWDDVARGVVGCALTSGELDWRLFGLHAFLQVNTNSVCICLCLVVQTR